MLHIVRFCAEECTRQQSGEMSVYWMVDAWDYAAGCPRHKAPWIGDVFALGQLVEPVKNAGGFRRTPVTIDFVVIPWENITRQLESLMEAIADGLPADQVYKEFEEIHPFLDGNGRVGKLLYNWVRGTLQDPVFPPDFWGKV